MSEGRGRCLAAWRQLRNPSRYLDKWMPLPLFYDSYFSLDANSNKGSKTIPTPNKWACQHIDVPQKPSISLNGTNTYNFSFVVFLSSVSISSVRLALFLQCSFCETRWNGNTSKTPSTAAFPQYRTRRYLLIAGSLCLAPIQHPSLASLSIDEWISCLIDRNPLFVKI